MLLYLLYDMHRASLKPLWLWAEAVQSAARHPFFPGAYTGFPRAVAASAELMARATRHYGKPPFDLPSCEIGGETVPVREEVALRLPFCDLVHFRRLRPAHAARRDPRVLIVAPLSGHHSTLLRGTVAALLPDHEVYVTDWTEASLVPLSAGRFDLDTNITYIMAFLRHLGPGAHVMAVCQPAVPALAATALLAAADEACQPRSLVLMGGPIDVDAAPTGPSLLAQLHPLEWFERTVITTVPLYYPGALRRVFPGFIQLSGFMTMNLDRHIGAHFQLFNHLIQGDGESAAAHRRFYDEYLSVMDLPAEFYLQTVDTVFHRRALARGTMTWEGVPVDPGAIRRTALMTVEGERDDISAPGQTYAAHALCPNVPADQRDHLLQPGVGHFGIFNGRRWRGEVMPRVRAFMRRFDPEAAPLLP